MANESTTYATAGTLPKGLVWIGQRFLLVPEAVLIAAVLCVYIAFGEFALLALLALLLMACFIVRIIALHVARHALDARRYREAEAFAQIALFLYPWSADGLALYGALALAVGQAEQAEERLRRAIALLPHQPAFHAALSGALLEQQRFIEAAATARHAITLAPSYALAHLYLAEAERAAGLSATLIEEHLREGLSISTIPEVTAALQCGLAGHLLGERRMAEAMLAMRSVEALLPRCPTSCQAELRFHLGALLDEQGQVDRAREHFRNVESLDPQGRYAAAAWRRARLF